MRRTAPLWALVALALLPLTAARTHAQTQPVATGGSVITQTESPARSSWTWSFLERFKRQYVPSARPAMPATEWQRARLIARTPGTAIVRRDRIRLP
jgi:hypothetical protein